MKYFIVALFIVSLLSVCFLSLNYLWGWFPIDYGVLAKVIFSGFVILLAITGLAMIFSGATAEKPSQPNVGKR